MTREEFGKAMVVLSSGLGREITEDQLSAWWLVIGDLPAQAVETAILRYLREATDSWLPAPGVIVRLAVESRDGRRLSAVEAYRAATDAVCVRVSHDTPAPPDMTDRERDLWRRGYPESVLRSRALAGLDPVTREAVRIIGAGRIEHEHGEGVLFAHFGRVYGDLVQRDEQCRLLPAELVPRIRDDRPQTRIDRDGAVSIGDALRRALPQYHAEAGR